MELFARYLCGLVEEASLGIVRGAFPSSVTSSAPDYPALALRNGWINAVAHLWFVVGFGMTLLLAPGPAGNWPMVGIACGVAVVVSFAWVCLVTLPYGLGRYREFWRFHRMYYEIDTVGAVVLALPLVVTGAICVAVVMRSGALL